MNILAVALERGYFNSLMGEQHNVQIDSELVPVRHGHWINERNPMMYQSYPYVWVCDQCGTAFYYKTPYCGECGARMEEDV